MRFADAYRRREVWEKEKPGPKRPGHLVCPVSALAKRFYGRRKAK